MRERLWMSLTAAMALALAVVAAAQQPSYELTVESATLIRNGEPVELDPSADRFGPGLASVSLAGAPVMKTEVRWTCRDVPEGDYYVGLLMLQDEYAGYLCFSEHYIWQAQLYHNDSRVLWTSHTGPVRPEKAADQRHYQAEMRADEALHVKPGDTLRVVYANQHGQITVGPIRLYKEPPGGTFLRLDPPDWGKPRSLWLYADWDEPQRQGRTVTQSCWLYNPGALPRRFTLEASARDCLQTVLVAERRELELGPGERVTQSYSFDAGPSGTARLMVTATAEDEFPPVRLVKYYVDDRTEGPRPKTYLSGEWEMCYVPGAEPGDAPPADAEWTKITVPSLQPNNKGHCAWYRKAFDAPAAIRGERVVLRFGQVFSEAWFYVNGQAVGHERHGSQPFEVDITPAFKPGERNELLIAVRDWLAYSPKNRERVERGEEPIYKDNMIDVAGYTAAANLGIGGGVALEARPAVSVDDVFVVTSVQEKKLTLRYRLANRGKADQQVALTARVLDAGQAVKNLPPGKAKVAAGKTATVTLEMPWPDARLWWPEDPHLYVLETNLKPASGDADQHFQRFGFREMRIEGVSFYLNGVRTKIRSQWSSGANGLGHASAFWEPDKRLEAIWAWQTRMTQEADHQLTRTHLTAGVEEALEVADETGLMIKLESEVGQVNFTFDTVFWNAVLEHELRTMDVYKSHASVVMWSAGNENMWGWIYQGEAAKVLGNRWQVKIAKAMREADPMRRPIEWEADGDLMGGWEHHALHYPRELNTFPDVPNSAWWGPLDGKTVVPYSMGPITLGEKPLTVGEAFWPATLNRPYGTTIVMGDEGYLGGHYYARGWLRSSRFFINGFRDVEFALIDTYVPLYIQKPQTVVLKQEDRAFYGGRTVRREVNVHNDLRRPANLVLQWVLEDGKPLDEGRVRMKLGPADLGRTALDIRLPAVDKPTEATLRLTLSEDGRQVHSESRVWQVHPAPAIRVPEGLELAVYDPVGETAATLTGLKVPFQRIEELSAPAGKALILGRDALKNTPEGPWRESLAAFVREGGKVLVLEQAEAPDFTPVVLTQVRKNRTTMAYVRAADHPVLKGLDDGDLRWWADDHYVSAGNYRKPTRGNYLPLADVGTMDGIVETPLMEQYEGKGSYLLCQMLLTDKAAVAPAAGRLLQNLLDYLAAPGTYRAMGETALFAGAGCPLRKALEDSRAVYQDLTGKAESLAPESFRVALVDVATALDAALAPALRAFAEGGGRVMLHRVTPEKQQVAEAVLGLRIRLSPMQEEPRDVQQQLFRGPSVGPVAGISNHELFWASNTYLKELRHEGCWWSGYPGECPAEERIAEYLCTPADEALGRAAELTHPCALLQVPAGAGYVLVSNLRMDEPLAETEVTVSRLRSLLLTNLGCTLRGEGGAVRARRERLKQYEYFTVDLAPYANRGLRDDPQAGIVGWTNQGENDMRALPTGRQAFADIPFQIASPKAAVVLYSVAGSNKELPKEVTGIKIGRRADVLFFLHSVAWSGETPFKYRVNYDDGTSVEIPIQIGQHVVDWWDDPKRYTEAMSRHGMFVAWQGDNPMRQGVILPGYEWVNPHPDKVVRDVDFLTVPESGYGSVPVLAGITGAVTRTTQGLVVDVIGTRGIRVRLGTQEQDIYYIGTVGIPEDHRYYAEAVEAHKALAVGQKVRVVDDVVTQNTAGERIAYVYLADDSYDLRNLLNAKIIGDGLGKLGNFEGNARHRMYLDNLGFIAQQRKKGLWGAEGGQ